MNGQTDPLPLLSVRNLRKSFPIRSKGLLRRHVGTVHAVNDISFDLMPGCTLALVGESGSGKTTTARTILRAMRPTSGQVLLRVDGKSVDLATLGGRELRQLRTRMQMIFQDPFSSLNPRMTVEQIVGEPLRIHRLGAGRDIRRRAVEMLGRVGMGEACLSRYPHEFSGGQRQRIGIARALIMNPALVVADEPVSALDVSVQAQVINLLEQLQRELNLTYLFVAHDLSVVRHISDRVAVMYAGRIVELARTESLFESPNHPYTRALLAAVPSVDPDVPLSPLEPGEVADMSNLPPGCAFAPRCPGRSVMCDRELPPLATLADGRCVACHACAAHR